MPQHSRRPTAGILAAVLVGLLTGCTPTVTYSPAPASSTPRATEVQPLFGDHGRRQYATGSARLIGGVYRYVVADGDTATGIAGRFGTTPDAVAAASRGGFEIFRGDVLRLTH